MTAGPLGYHPAIPMDLRLLPYEPDRDAYRLLGVPPSAGRAEIVAACRRLARAFHPDRNGSQRATEEMQVVNAVRSLLADPRSRAEYDRARLSFWSTMPRFRPDPRAAAPLPAPLPAPRPSVPAPRASVPAPAEPRGRPELSRTARAAMAGLLGLWRSLPPARCDRCGAWAEPDYRFCGECGAPFREAQRLNVG